MSSTLFSFASFCLICASSCLLFFRAPNARSNTSSEIGGLKLWPSTSSHWSIEAFSNGFVPYRVLFPWSAYFSAMYLHIALEPTSKGKHLNVDELWWRLINTGKLKSQFKFERKVNYGCLPNREMLSSSIAGICPKLCFWARCEKYKWIMQTNKNQMRYGKMQVIFFKKVL